ncbi:precorrin-6A/cobalt-precorrin-6A reductase [Aureivirga sp. CE67]|uniref:precorrin-6A/cobalt-precorrin-6A reductase n=1 Tax=Aureivirga sp. CE67 TaxID=1788983 RepID=UPI0018CAEB2B|nr:precorrin-6A/cobalt-precorrin-6A reductase [Aureivirga sp. CE67]
MILLFGGTTEGKKVATYLDQIGKTYFYSTKTEVSFSGKGNTVFGAMNSSDITAFCLKNNISLIINASHPFAENLHREIAEAAIQIPLVRFERKQLPEEINPLLFYAKDYPEFIQKIESFSPTKILSFTGVNTIEKLKTIWKKHPSIFRILDRDISRKVAEKSNFPKENLRFGIPQNYEEEIAFIQKENPSLLLTKENGFSGKLDVKIKIAKELNIPLFILKTPKISSKYKYIQSVEQLKPFLHE